MARNFKMTPEQRKLRDFYMGQISFGLISSGSHNKRVIENWDEYYTKIAKESLDISNHLIKEIIAEDAEIGDLDQK